MPENNPVWVDILPDFKKFQRNFVEGSKKAFKHAPAFEPTVQLSQKSVSRLKRDLRQLETGKKAALSLGLDTSKVDRDVRELKSKIARQQAAKIGLTVDDKALVQDAKETGKKAGKDYSAAFASATKRATAGAAGVAKRGASKAGSLAVGGLALAGKGAAVGVAAAAAAAVKGVKTYAEFDAVMRQTQAQIGGSTDALSALAIKMGQDTVFSAKDAADAILELAKSGMTQAQIKGGALASTLKLAAAGGLNMGDAAGYMTNSMNAFGLSARDGNKIVTALAGGANASTASVQSLGLGLAQAGAGARNAGLTLNDTVAVLSAFDNAGIKGADAGTSLKTMLQRLVPQTKQAKAAMEKYNLSFVNADGSFKNITQVAQELQTHLGGLSQAQKAQALQTIFGSDATRAATVLMRNGASGINKYEKATKDSSAAQKMANARMTGVNGAIQNLQGSFETMTIVIGRALAPAFTMLANWLAQRVIPAVTRFIGYVQKHWPAIQAVIVDTWQKIQPVLVALGTYAAKIVREYWPVVQKIIVGVTNYVVGAVRKHWPQISAIISSVFTTVKTVISGAVTVVQAIWKRFGSNILRQLRITWDTFVPVIKGVMKTVRGVIDVITGLIHGDWSKVWKGIKEIFGGIWQQIIGLARGFLRTLKNVLGAGVKALQSIGSRIIGGLWDGMKAALGKPYDWIKSHVFDPVVHAVKSLFGIHSPSRVMKDLGSRVMEGFVKGMLIHNPVEVAKKLVKDIPGLLGGAVNNLRTNVIDPTGKGSFAGGGKSGLQRIAKASLGQFGWGADQWSALNALVTGESGWNPNAQNPGSTAYGLFQFLNSTWSSYGPKTSNPLKQLSYGLQYIRDRYGSPAAAYAAWLSRIPHWYARGTKGAKPGLAVVGEQGPELINLRGGEQIFNARQTKLMGYAKGTLPSSVNNVLKFLTSAIKSLTGNSSASRLSEVGGNSLDRVRSWVSSIVGASNDTISKSKSSLASLRKSTASELDRMAKDRQKAYAKIAAAQAVLNAPRKNTTNTQRRNASVTIAAQNKAIKENLADRSKLIRSTATQTQKLLAAINGASATGSAAKLAGSDLVKAVQAVNAKLQALASQRDKIAQQLSDARSFSADISSNARSGALAGAASQSVAGVQANLSANVNNVKRFTALIRQMSHKGFNRSILSQVVAMGVQDGSNLAQVLVKASKPQVKALNGTQNALNYQSGVLGNVGTSASLGAGASTNYIGHLVSAKNRTSAQLASAERREVSIVNNNFLTNDAQIDALSKRMAFAVSR